VIFDTFVSTG